MKAYEKSIAISTGCHRGEDNLDTAITLFQVGVVMLRRGDTVRAKGKFENSLAILKRIFAGQEKNNRYIIRVQREIDRIEEGVRREEIRDIERGLD
jgi:hypothetical protein